MSEALIRWLVELGKNPSLAAEFQQNPKKAMEAAGLTSELEKQVVLARDLVGLRGIFSQPRPRPRAMAINIGL